MNYLRPDNDLAPLIPHGGLCHSHHQERRQGRRRPIPAELVPYYGTSFPLGGMVYLRLRPSLLPRGGAAAGRSPLTLLHIGPP